MTQTQLLKKLDYNGIIGESFEELLEKVPEALDLMGKLLDYDHVDNADIQIICRCLISTMIKTHGPIFNTEVIVHLVASAMINGFLQGALAAHKIIETEELERIGKL